MTNPSTESAFTPGPWNCLEDSDEPNGQFTIKGQSGFPHVACVFFRNTDEEAEANAKLIASAPSLLEACKTQLENMKMLQSGEWDGSAEGVQCAIDDLEAVIAQAS